MFVETNTKDLSRQRSKTCVKIKATLWQSYQDLGGTQLNFKYLAINIVRVFTEEGGTHLTYIM